MSKRLLSLLAVTALFGGTLTTTLAHARFVESIPAPDSVVGEEPTTVTIWFSELLEPDGNRIHVFAPDGARIDLDDVARLPDNHKALRVSMPPGLTAGSYRVSWANVSAEDGDPASGEFSFTLGWAAVHETTSAARPEPLAP